VQLTFMCVSSVCIGPTPFNGAACVNDTDCALGEKCSMYIPYSPGENTGACRLPCDPDATCQPRAGVPQVCCNLDVRQCQ
jgi:hypothetical protein